MSERKRYYLIHAFCDQRLTAASRGIPFLLTFEQWLDIWQESGHLGQRGRGPGRYCMARFGDRGAYEIGNVRIATNRENREEQALNISDETREKMRAAKLGTTQSAETRAKRAASKTGQKDSEDTKKRKSLAKIGNKHAIGFIVTPEIVAKRNASRAANKRAKALFMEALLSA